MQDRLLAAQTAFICWISSLRREEGQGSTEYAGAIVIAALLIAAFIGAASGFGETIKGAAEEAINKIVGKG